MAQHVRHRDEPSPSLAHRLSAVRQTLASACERANRDPSSVALVAVTKYASLGSVREIIDLGHTMLGESRPQQLIERAGMLGFGPPSWHLIGPLQRNKVRKVLPFVAMIHSAGNLSLLQTIDRLAQELNLRPRVLIEVNTSGETTKQGFAPSQLDVDWPQISSLHHVDVRGLMTLAPLSTDPEASRPCFRALRELRDHFATLSSREMPELSMGMSGDYEVAIEEGATLVRIGTALFG